MRRSGFMCWENICDASRTGRRRICVRCFDIAPRIFHPLVLVLVVCLPSPPIGGGRGGNGRGAHGSRYSQRAFRRPSDGCHASVDHVSTHGARYSLSPHAEQDCCLLLVHVVLWLSRARNACDGVGHRRAPGSVQRRGRSQRLDAGASC